MAYINTEGQFYVVSVTELVCSIMPIEKVETNEETVYLKKATIKENSDDIPITVFSEPVDKVKEQSRLQISGFQSIWPAEISTIQKAEREKSFMSPVSTTITSS